MLSLLAVVDLEAVKMTSRSEKCMDEFTLLHAVELLWKRRLFHLLSNVLQSFPSSMYFALSSAFEGVPIAILDY